MKMFRLTTLIIASTALIWACGSEGTDTTDRTEETEKTEEAPREADPRGIGEVTHVELTDPLDEDMIKVGESIYDMKCSACHKLSDQRVVGPGWAGITNKRRPEWIMNMITNVDVMLDEDPVARQLLEECLTRMPNQGVSITEARSIVEFMRDNDLRTVGTKDEAVNQS